MKQPRNSFKFFQIVHLKFHHFLWAVHTELENVENISTNRVKGLPIFDSEKMRNKSSENNKIRNIEPIYKNAVK